jgi:catechol 2,3-dioxygenase-like lactoylglutathione lyase family enzyme
MAVMTVQLNHTIIPARDKHLSSTFLAEVLGLPAPTAYGPFMEVAVANDVTLDFQDSGDDLKPGHWAFLVGEAEFDEIFARIVAQGVAHWADPGQRRPDEINHDDGGRGVYFADPDGHLLEIITRPYSKD